MLCWVSVVPSSRTHSFPLYVSLFQSKMNERTSSMMVCAKWCQEILVKLWELWNHILGTPGFLVSLRGRSTRLFSALVHCSSVALSSLLVIFSETLPFCFGLGNTSVNSDISELIYSSQHQTVQNGLVSFATVVVIYSLDSHCLVDLITHVKEGKTR